MDENGIFMEPSQIVLRVLAVTREESDDHDEAPTTRRRFQKPVVSSMNRKVVPAIRMDF